MKKVMSAGIMLLMFIVWIPVVSAGTEEPKQAFPENDTAGFGPVDVIFIDPAVKAATPHYIILIADEEGRRNLLDSLNRMRYGTDGRNISEDERAQLKNNLLEIWEKYPVDFIRSAGASGYPTYGGSVLQIRFAGNRTGIRLTDSENTLLERIQVLDNYNYLRERNLGVISEKGYLSDKNTSGSDTGTTESFTVGQLPPGEAYMLQTGPTTIPPFLCEPLDIPVAPPLITIDPITLHGTGESFVITGTTTLPADQEIRAEIMTADLLSLKSNPKDIFGQTGMVERTKSPDGTGRWEYHINTSGWVPDKYLVQIIPVSGNISSDFTASIYLLSPEEAAEIQKLPVTIDPISHHYEDEIFLIGGNTTVMPGQELTVSIVQGSFSLRGEFPTLPDDEIPGLVEKTRVGPGSNGKNRWSFSVNTTGLRSNTYFIDIFSTEGDHVGRSFFFLEYNPRRTCRILAVPDTPPRTPTKASLSSEIVIGSIICGVFFIAGKLKG